MTVLLLLSLFFFVFSLFRPQNELCVEQKHLVEMAPRPTSDLRQRDTPRLGIGGTVRFVSELASVAMYATAHAIYGAVDSALSFAMQRYTRT